MPGPVVAAITRRKFVSLRPYAVIEDRPLRNVVDRRGRLAASAKAAPRIGLKELKTLFPALSQRSHPNEQVAISVQLWPRRGLMRHQKKQSGPKLPAK